MGRIKTSLIKRLTFELLEKYKPEFKESFAENKPVVAAHLSESSKKIRNAVAGYITRIVQDKERLANV